MNHRLLSPNYRARLVTDITPDFLKKLGIKAAMLDLDGNLIGYRSPEASPEVTAWIANMLAEGIALCLVSNPGPSNTLAQIAQQLGLQAFRGTVPKPLPVAFLKAKRYLKTPFSKTAMIGDQLFTDILGGNALGMTTIWTDKVSGHAEGWITQNLNRQLERVYINRILDNRPSMSPYIIPS